MSHIRHKNVNYAKFSNSNLQLPVYAAYKSLQKITNLMIRHITWHYFLESCGSAILLWCCYTTKEASQFRTKVAKIILAETNVETFNTFIGYVILFKYILWTCFKVISQNCEEGFTICLYDSWSLLDFCYFFLILLSWLWNHEQSQQQKNKVRSGGSLRGGVARGFCSYK